MPSVKTIATTAAIVVATLYVLRNFGGSFATDVGLNKAP